MSLNEPANKIAKNEIASLNNVSIFLKLNL